MSYELEPKVHKIAFEANAFCNESWRACTGRHLVRYIMKQTLATVSDRLPELQWDGNNVPRESGFVHTIKPGSLRFIVGRPGEYPKEPN